MRNNISITSTTRTRTARIVAGVAATGTALLLATGAASAGTTSAHVTHVQPVSAHRPATAAHDVTRIGTAVRYVRGAHGQPVLVR